MYLNLSFSHIYIFWIFLSVRILAEVVYVCLDSNQFRLAVDVVFDGAVVVAAAVVVVAFGFAAVVK